MGFSYCLQECNLYARNAIPFLFYQIKLQFYPLVFTLSMSVILPFSLFHLFHLFTFSFVTHQMSSVSDNANCTVGLNLTTNSASYHCVAMLSNLKECLWLEGGSHASSSAKLQSRFVTPWPKKVTNRQSTLLNLPISTLSFSLTKPKTITFKPHIGTVTCWSSWRCH